MLSVLRRSVIVQSFIAITQIIIEILGFSRFSDFKVACVVKMKLFFYGLILL